MTRDPEPLNPPPTALQYFLIMSRIGLTSFGGGLSGWLLRVFVQERRWIGEEDFLDGLSLSQALPGVKVKNLAIWIGYRLIGPLGAVAGFTGIIVPPAIVIVLIDSVFTALQRFPITHAVLVGAAAAAIGLSLSMGLTVARRVPRRSVPIVVMGGTFVAVALLHWPLVWVLLIAGSANVGWAYVTLPRD